MATLLDATLLGKFTNIMMFLLVFVITYAIFQLTNILKSKNLNAFVAFLLAFFTILNPNVTKLVSILIPWLFIMLLILVFILVGMVTLGVRTSDIEKAMGHWGPFHVTFLGFLGFIVLIAFSQVYGAYFLNVTSGTNPSSGSAVNATTSGSDLTENVMKIFVTPQVLSIVLIFLIAAFAVMWLTFPP